MENRPFEDLSSRKMGIIHCYVSVPEGRRFADFCPISFPQTKGGSDYFGHPVVVGLYYGDDILASYIRIIS